MNDNIAKITLCVIASLSIAAAVVVSAYTTSTIASAFIQLAAVCIGGISGVAVQGAFTKSVPTVSTIVPESVSLSQTPVDTSDTPDVV